MKMTESRNTHRNSTKVRSSSRARPEIAVRVGGRQVHLGDRGAQRLDPVGLAEAGQDRGPEPVLAAAGRSGRCGRPPPRARSSRRCPAARARPVLARHVEARDRPRVAAVALREPELHVVVVVHGRVPEARHLLVAAHHQAQGLRDLLGVHPQVGGARAVDLDAQLRLVELEGGVRVDDAPERPGPLPQVLAVLREQGRDPGPRMTKSMSKLPPPVLNEGALRTVKRRSGMRASRRRTSCITSRWLQVPRKPREGSRRTPGHARRGRT